MMKKQIVFILLAAVFVLTLFGCSSELNSGSEDVLYNDIVYKRTEFPNYSLELLHDNRTYIGDFYETYAYGQQLPWEVYTLNSNEDVLFSAHALWIRPGYVFPDEYGEDFTKAEYVISEGLLDTYKEETTPLITFEKSVKLEDIIAAEPTEVTEYTEYADVRLYYKNHADMTLLLQLCGKDGVYYLNVRSTLEGDPALYRINDEYVEALTAALAKTEA